MEKHNYSWKIRELLGKIHLINFPEYQREPTVWNLEKKQRLIDSILRGFDISPIYLFMKKTHGSADYTYDCVDGRQRINAILSYMGENKDLKDNEFRLNIVNEIYEDADQFDGIDNTRYKDLSPERQNRILDYMISVVGIGDVENEQELNLLFLRLQGGQILNAGEKLNAMTGEMRKYVFEELGKHAYFDGIIISFRRFAREQVAAQIALNYFSKNETGYFHRSRYIDLQEFLKKYSVFQQNDKVLATKINERLDIICQSFGEKLKTVTNRAIAVSLFLFVSELVDQNKQEGIAEFTEYLVKLITTLKWQIPLTVKMDAAYYHLLDFQTYVTQAAGEKYAIEKRHDFLNKGFEYYKQNNKAIEGDSEFKRTSGSNADEARATI